MKTVVMSRILVKDKLFLFRIVSLAGSLETEGKARYITLIVYFE
jgi:hypothetical protein